MMYKELKKDEHILWGCIGIIYVLGFPFFLILRYIHLEFAISAGICILLEFLGFVLICIWYYVQYNRRCRKVLHTIEDSAMASSVIDELKDLLQHHKGSDALRHVVELSLVKAYVFDGNVDDAMLTIMRLEHQKLHKAQFLRLILIKAQCGVFLEDYEMAQTCITILDKAKESLLNRLHIMEDYRTLQQLLTDVNDESFAQRRRMYLQDLMRTFTQLHKMGGDAS